MIRKLIYVSMVGLMLSGTGCFFDSDDEDDDPDTDEAAVVEDSDVDVNVDATDKK